MLLTHQEFRAWQAWRDITAKCCDPEHPSYREGNEALPEQWNTFEGFIGELGLPPQNCADCDYGEELRHVSVWAAAEPSYLGARVPYAYRQPFMAGDAPPLVKVNTYSYPEFRAYQAWVDMHCRCYEPTHPKYPEEGGKGVTVCERWHYFNNFLADVGPPPDEEIDAFFAGESHTIGDWVYLTSAPVEENL